MDSLGKEAAFLANRNELNLDDLFFNYGQSVRRSSGNEQYQKTLCK